MKKFILSGAYMMNHTELSIEPPQIYNSLLEARKAMLGNIMLDLEEEGNYCVESMDDGSIRFTKGPEKLYSHIGEAITKSAWVDLEEFSSTYEIREIAMEVQ